MTRATLRDIATPALLAMPFVVVSAWMTLRVVTPPALLPVLGAMVLYLAAHGLRVVRMVLLLGERSPSLRGVAIAHALTTPVGGMLPLKLGELVRIAALGRAARGLSDGLRAVWIERVFDAGVLALAGLLVMADGGQGAALVTTVAIGVLLVTMALLRPIPEALRHGKAFLIRRYTTDWSLVALRRADAAARWMEDARHLVDGRAATLGLLTVALWSLEVLAFQIGTAGLSGEDSTLASAMSLLSDGLRFDRYPPPDVWAWVLFAGQMLVAMAGLALLFASRRDLETAPEVP